MLQNQIIQIHLIQLIRRYYTHLPKRPKRIKKNIF